MFETWTLEPSERPIFPKDPTTEERQALQDLRSELTLMHRHEDTLLNSRLQGFIVGTSLLVAAIAQFREPEFLPAAVVVAVAGFSLSAMTDHILCRTSKAIEWYITAIRDLELILVKDECMRPYDTRRIMTKRGKVPVSRILGCWLPRGTTVFWILLLGYLILRGVCTC